MTIELKVQTATGKSFLRALGSTEPSILEKVLGFGAPTQSQIKAQQDITENVENFSTFQSFEPDSLLSVKGKYLTVTLSRILVGLPVQYSWGDEQNDRKTVIQAIYHNPSTYRISKPSVRIVDSDGFQHQGESASSWKSQLKNTKILLNSHDDDIEDLAKTRGWLCFDDLDDGVFPQRIIFELHLFEPGHTCGSVLGEQIVEFFIKSSTTSIIN